jgi:hypothetical protein
MRISVGGEDAVCIYTYVYMYKKGSAILGYDLPSYIKKEETDLGLINEESI